MARLCPNCRVELRARSKFCPNCGTTALAAEAAGGGSVQVVESVESVSERRATHESEPVRTERSGPSVLGPPEERIGAYEQAGFGLRFGALLFDLLIIMIVWMGATFALSALSNKSVVSSNSMLGAVYTVGFVLYLLNFVLLAGRNGQTLGKQILGIQIVHEDGRPIGLGTALYRHLVGYFLSAIVVFLGFIWIVWDPKQQGWHDKLARTYVVVIA